MTMQKVYAVIGVPGSGKSWVCEQLQNQYTYVPHDLDYESHVERTLQAAQNSDKPVLIDIPHAERSVRDALIAVGLDVQTLFIVEPVSVVAARYLSRTAGKVPMTKSMLTRAVTIVSRAIEWQSPYGTSEEILGLLKSIS